MTGGCKPPKCDPELKECQRIQTAFRNLYSYCMQSAHGKFPACLRSKFDSNTSLNVPIYASVCDALCHESEPEKLQGLTVCDSPAEEDESLSGHFGAWLKKYHYLSYPYLTRKYYIVILLGTWFFLIYIIPCVIILSRSNLTFNFR